MEESRWRDAYGRQHRGTFRSPRSTQDDNYSFKFDKPGTYKYVCSIHPKMMAQIVVK